MATDRIAFEATHARVLWGCLFRERSKALYDSYYAIIIAVYRAEARRRGVIIPPTWKVA